MNTLQNSNLKAALIQAFDSELDAIEFAANSSPHTFSNEFSNRMNEVMKMSRYKYSTVCRRRVRRSSAIAIAAALILCMSVAVYAVVKNIPISINDEKQDVPWNMEVLIEGSTDEALQESFEYVIPTTPEGFKIKERFEEPLHLQIIYEDSSGDGLFYSQVFAGEGSADVSISDSDKVEVKQEMINGRNAVIMYRDNLCTIIIEDGTNIFTIHGGEKDYNVLYNMALEVTAAE